MRLGSLNTFFLSSAQPPELLTAFHRKKHVMALQMRMNRLGDGDDGPLMSSLFDTFCTDPPHLPLSACASTSENSCIGWKTIHMTLALALMVQLQIDCLHLALAACSFLLFTDHPEEMNASASF